MSRTAITISITLIFGLFVSVLFACSRDSEKKGEWTVRLKNGSIIAEWQIERSFELRRAFHKKLNFGHKLEKNKKLIETLSMTEANKNQLEFANLRGAYLEKANLEAANLQNADLYTANLNEAILMAADLRGAKMTVANLSGANLRDADLRDANLSLADMNGADLRGADLRQAQLDANLSGANLSGADLSAAILTAADLREADLRYARLINTDMVGADLRQAKLISADLSDADLRKVDLRGADLNGAILKGANLMGAVGLRELRESFRKAGSRENVRLVTYHMKHTEWENSCQGGFLDIIKSLFNLIFYDLTCQYGLKPNRPLIILICFLPYFAIFNTLALVTENRKAGISLILLKKRCQNTTIKERPFKLNLKFSRMSLPAGNSNKIGFKIRCWIRAIRLGFYFSLLSAFNIGGRTVNAKGLITRLQRRDYALRATGPVRFLAGLQSLLSIFLLALWVMTTVGNPF